MDQPKILIIDDEKVICDACFQVLTQEHYKVEVSRDGISGLAKVEEFSPDVVFVDLKMPGVGGIEVLERIREREPMIVPIVITGYGTVESAVDSMKMGAFDFLPKPFTPDQLRVITRRALDKRNAALKTERLREEKEKMRQNFITMVSHELRTPLVAVTQYLEVLHNGFAGGVSGEQMKIVDRMRIRMDELLSLIDRWLRLARLEDLKVKDEFKEFPLSTVIAEAIDSVKDLACAAKVRIHFDATAFSATVMGDQHMIKEVFVNLVGNGIKYNRERGDLSVEFREESDYWIVAVSDTGVGISANDIPFVADEFYRVKREGAVAGTGIGLAIVKKILDLHGGKLQIESKLDQGSTFSVFLPKAKE
ncbi:hypothetical protein AMJ83_00265 [candidate division WOR_3 bacterium SM23_42]|uniref:histidine kinase n=1 Tax=candidate division WOR_3 bacterium SM23_42 TaxID=1703779 RepID=A0A0S8FWF0_UNCW3|nr:MAG: hypothetical protein AMJ83_00265 [candidate division WOR_3 bacterium SM23_42]